MSSIIDRITRRSTEHVVQRVKTQRVSAESLAKDGQDTIHRRLVEKTVKPTLNEQEATAVEVLKALAIAGRDLVSTCKLYGIAPDAAAIRQAQACVDLQALSATPQTLETDRSGCLGVIKYLLAQGKSVVTIFGSPQALDILHNATHADLDRARAAWPGAQAAIAAREAQEQAKRQKAAERKAKAKAHAKAPPTKEEMVQQLKQLKAQLMAFTK